MSEESSFSKGAKSTAGGITVIIAMGLGILVFLLVLERFGPPTRWTWRPSVATGTPGSGYVAGAPRNAQECVARGGRDLGRGCTGYR